MSDAVLIALFGIIGTALSALLGAVATGYITYRATKLQLNTQLETLGQQIRHQQEEARRNRIVEARKGYLMPLRKELLNYIHESTSQQGIFISMELASQAGVDASAHFKLLENFKAQCEATFEASKKLHEYLGQISDSSLAALIDDLFGSETKSLPRLLSLAQSAMAFGASIRSGQADGETLTAEFQRQMSEIKTLGSQRQVRLTAVNKKIEELLSGDESS